MPFRKSRLSLGTFWKELEGLVNGLHVHLVPGVDVLERLGK